MVSLAQRRLDASYLAAVLELIAIIVISAAWAHLTGQTELIVAAISSSVVVGLMLGVQWRRTKRGAARTFQPEMMPAIVGGLVITRAVSAALPSTLPNLAALSLELLCAVGAGGALGLLFALPAVRKAANETARLLL